MPQPSNIWVDEGPLDPAWGPPSVDEPKRRRFLSWLPGGIPLLVVVLVIVLVAAFGGFGKRTDELVRLDPGTSFEAGPYVFQFEKATIQQVDGYGEQKRITEVVVYGTARNTWTEAIIPANEQFAASDLAGNESAEASYVTLSASNGPMYLTPGLPPQDIQVEFEFSGDYDPGKEIRFLTFDLTYGDRSYLGVGGDEAWYNHGDRFLQNVPVTRLAAEET